MIQATDLVQYSMGVTIQETRAKQNFNMAKKDYYDIVCFEHAKCTVKVINTIQMFKLFQYGRQFPRWPPSAIT